MDKTVLLAAWASGVLFLPALGLWGYVLALLIDNDTTPREALSILLMALLNSGACYGFFSWAMALS